MSFNHRKKVIEHGDTVIIFIGFDNMLTFIVEANKTHQTKYGALPHKDLIGKKFGSKIQCARGWVYVLHPTPELWTVNLPHRTQILYSTDISWVIFQLDLKPGSIVVEAGTGSGSLSHALIRTIAPSGHLHTFDFHQQRVEAARKEFEHHGISEYVSVQQRDVCVDGFDLEEAADAIFLDLPIPWDALPFAKKAFKSGGGRICSFSPCIEQVQKTCEVLRQLSFVDVQSFECLLRPFDVKSISMPLADLGTSAHRSEQKMSETNRLDEPNQSNQKFKETCVAPISDYSANIESGKDSDDDERMSFGEADGDVCLGPKGNTSKKIKTAEDEKQKDATGTAKSKKLPVDLNKSFTFTTGLTPMQMPGHTGYLTFATQLAV